MGKHTITDKHKAILDTCIGSLFSNIDFSHIDETIDKISENHNDLNDKFKQQAVNYVDEWYNDMTTKLNEKQEKLEEIGNFFFDTSYDFPMIEQYADGRTYFESSGKWVKRNGILPVIINILSQGNKEWKKAAKEFAILQHDIQQLINRRNITKPDKADYMNDDLSYDDRILHNKQYEIAYENYCNQYNKEITMIRYRFLVIMRNLMHDSEIQQFLDVIKDQIKHSKRVLSVLNNKTSVCKIAICFGGTGLLDAFKQLTAFKETV